jgi:hypothetical protein
METFDLTKILKDCPEGAKLYSVNHGVVSFVRIVDGSVDFRDINGTLHFVDKFGRYINIGEECTLFPSRDNRDWSTFKPELPQHNFEPFEKVLVWDPIDGFWGADFYAYFDTNSGLHQCVMHSARVCLPFDGNEHLLGTTNEPNFKAD